MRVSPSIIAVDYKNEQKLNDALKMLEKAQASMVHLDVMDGKYVKNKTFDHQFVDGIKNKTWLMADVHLMVKNPDDVVENYIKAGADIITVHFNATKDLEGTLKKIKAKNLLAGVALSPADPAECLEKILKTGLVDIVLVMGVEPGACGQEFIPGMGEKVAAVREMSRNVLIEVDGGVTLKNAKMLKKMGANILVSGSFVFKAEDPKKAIASFKKV